MRRVKIRWLATSEVLRAIGSGAQTYRILDALRKQIDDRAGEHLLLAQMEPVSLWSRLRAWLVNDELWEPTYRSLVASVVAVWITVCLIGLAAWAQVYFPAASQPVPHADGTHNAGIEAASGKGSL